MKIWITGILGFLGSSLAKELTIHGHDVYGNDSMICSALDPITVTRECKNDTTCIRLGDCRDFDLMKKWLSPAIDPPEIKADVLIHCAATAHEGLSNFSPSFITRNIYEASVATFSAAIASGIKRIIFMSSMARYGCSPTIPFLEDIHTPSPVDPYGIAKVAAEQTLIALCKLHNIEYVIAVPHNIIGPRQNYRDPYRNVASIMIHRALLNKPILIYGDGEQKRCFSPIVDCMDSLIKMIDAPISGEIINIGPDKGQITINELARKIINFTSSCAGIKHIPERPNEVKEAWCSSDKARNLLGFREKQSLDDCLKEMVLYIKNQLEIIKETDFQYSFPIEIEKGCPGTWMNKTI